MSADADLHYSGDTSVEFWTRINTARHAGGMELFEDACALQELEARVMKRLKQEEEIKL